MSRLSSAQVLCQPQLVWHDEFNTPGNFTLWKVYEGDGCNESSGCGFGNAEQQLYRAANAVVADTSLTIFTKFETVVNPVDNKTFKYTSAKLMSKLTGVDSLQNFLFGRVEARIKLPSAGGVWPGFWLLSPLGGWPNTGEIDIMEAKHKNPSEVNGTIHYAYPSGVHQQSGTKYIAGIDLSADYHVYAVEWGPYQINWYVDNNLYFTQTPETTVGGSWPFDANKMYIILNVAVGGTGAPYTGKIAPTPADYPTSMKVDYVRVYKGVYNYGVFGKNLVYPNQTYQDYRIDTITGATYNWTVPSGASIVSGQGTNLITVNWGTAGGNVSVNVGTSGCSTQAFTRKVQLKPALVPDKVYDDFETNRIAAYGPMTGTLQQAVANPLPERVNTSSLTGKYTRNSGSQYDDIYIGNIPIPNALDFVQGRKKLFIDVYTNAPVGSEVDMQLENTSLSLVNAFPSGRHSKYVAYTTRQNSWETLEFNYVQTISGSNTDIFSIDKMCLLMEPNKFTGSIYYFDNVRV
ncbi:MAG: glycoside hydrolase family 16 protein, partial [Bacteroidetes bacterium]|nr:glycoside hydrolase family 16 protein [Bacteroidota bacterium]